MLQQKSFKLKSKFQMRKLPVSQAVSWVIPINNDRVFNTRGYITLIFLTVIRHKIIFKKFQD